MRPQTIGPTARQKQVVAFLKTYCDANGFSPTVREIGDHLGVEVNAVSGHLKALERKGLITRQANKARTIRVIDGT